MKCRLGSAKSNRGTIALVALAVSCLGGAPPKAQPKAQPKDVARPLGRVPTYGYKVVSSFPHDPQAFTQGLVYLDGVLYEGTGQYGQSSLRKVALETGRVLEQRRLLPNLFGEGISVFEDRIFQLTWKSRVGFVYEKKGMKFRREFRYDTEGWGMTHDGEHLIVSNGSDRLFFWSPETLEPVRQLPVVDRGSPVHNLNELEYIKGEIYANVWQQDRIARIDPETGEVLAWIDLTGILPEEDARRYPVDVLNGIAYDADNDRIFVTGKLWPKLFEIELVPPENR